MQHVFPIVLVQLHGDEFAVIDVAEVLEILDAPVVPFHEEDPRHEPVRHQDAHTGAIILPKESPQGLIKPADPIVGIRGRLAVGDAVEEMPIICPLHPHALHLRGAWLEIAKVLLSQPRLFVDLDRVSRKRGRRRRIGGQGLENALGGLPSSAIGRGEEMNVIIWAQEATEVGACLPGLSMALGCEFDPMVGDGLVDITVFVPLGLGMTDQNDHLMAVRRFGFVRFCFFYKPTRGLPMAANFACTQRGRGGDGGAEDLNGRPVS